MPLSLDYQVLWNKYCEADDKAQDWLIKSFKMSGIDKKICHTFYEKYRMEAHEHIKLCVDLIKKGGWYVQV